MSRPLVMVVTCPLLLLTSSCTTDFAVRARPNAALGKDLTYHVLQRPEDEDGINVAICDQLKAWGRPATTGSIEEHPGNPDVLVSYTCKWDWEVVSYLLSIHIIFHDSEAGTQIAEGQSTRASFVRKSPAWHVNKILTAIFAVTNPDESAPAESVGAELE